MEDRWRHERQGVQGDRAPGLAQFAIFWLIAVTHGGDALNGKVVDGHYYIGGHNQYREVSHAFFVYSAIHSGVSMTSVLAVVLIDLRRCKRRSS